MTNFVSVFAHSLFCCFFACFVFRKERHGWMFFLLFGGMGLYASRTILPISLVSLTGEMKWNRKEAEESSTNKQPIHNVRLGGGKRQIDKRQRQCGPEEGGARNDTLASQSIAEIASQKLGFYYPSIISLMAKRVHSGERNFTHAVLNAGTHLGTLLCGSWGSYLVAVYGWRVPFAMIGCAFGFWSLATYTFMVRRRRIPCNLVPLLDRFVTTGSKGVPLGNDHSFIPDPENTLLNDKKIIEDHHILIMQSSPAKHSADAYKPHRPLAWDVLLRHPPFWAMLLANFAHNNSFYIILNWCPSYFHDNYPDARVSPGLVCKKYTLRFSVSFVYDYISRVCLHFHITRYDCLQS
ncbi:hypothetical protein AHF37_04337 [Paragonimus kellicotti]|nr:hypothetical protein AHF37_04337 [Paragonimus kellicotti]